MRSPPDNLMEGEVQAGTGSTKDGFFKAVVVAQNQALKCIDLSIPVNCDEWIPKSVRDSLLYLTSA